MHCSSVSSDSESSDSDIGSFTVITYGGKTRYVSGDETASIYIPGSSGGVQIGSGNICIGSEKSHHTHHRPSKSSHTHRTSSGSQKTHRSGESPTVYRDHVRHNKQLSDSDDPPTNSDLNHISKHIGNHWKQLASVLGLSRGEIETLEYDYQVEGQYEMAYQTLLKWKRLHGGLVTIKQLVVAIYSIGMSELASELPV